MPKIVTGEIDVKGIAVEWSIEDFFSLSIEDSVYYISPKFSFANQSWCLSMCPNGQVIKKSNGYISLYLSKESECPPISIEFFLGVKCLDNKLDFQEDYACVFNEIEGKGTHKLVSRTELLERIPYLLPSGALTLVCKIKHQKFNEFENKSTLSESSKLFCEHKVLTDLKELFLRKNHCDVVIKIKGHEFLAHKNILAARSPVFESTFRNDMKEKATGIVDIEDCDPSSFSDFLCFLYCGDVEIITVENVFSLFATSDKYDVSDLRERCLEFIKEKLSVDIFCDTISLALQHCESELAALATEFFIKNTLEIIKTIQWQRFSADNPIQSNELFIKLLESNRNLSPFY